MATYSSYSSYPSSYPSYPSSYPSYPSSTYPTSGMTSPTTGNTYVIQPQVQTQPRETTVQVTGVPAQNWWWILIVVAAIIMILLIIGLAAMASKNKY